MCTGHRSLAAASTGSHGCDRPGRGSEQCDSHSEAGRFDFSAFLADFGGRRQGAVMISVVGIQVVRLPKLSSCLFQHNILRMRL